MVKVGDVVYEASHPVGRERQVHFKKRGVHSLSTDVFLGRYRRIPIFMVLYRNGSGVWTNRFAKSIHYEVRDCE